MFPVWEKSLHDEIVTRGTDCLSLRFSLRHTVLSLRILRFEYHSCYAPSRKTLSMASKSKLVIRDSANNQKRDSSSSGKDAVETSGTTVTAVDLNDPDLLLPSVLPFKKTQLTDRYPKGQTRGRHWKHLKQIIQAENYYSYPADEPTYVSIEAPPSMYPPKKYCDITGFEAPYTDPRTKLRYANAEVFKLIRSLPEDTIQGYLALRNAAVVLK